MFWREQRIYHFNTEDSEHRRKTKFSAYIVKSDGTLSDSQTEGGPHVKEHSNKVKFEHRLIIIEPAMVLAFMLRICYLSTVTQYHYDVIGQRHNLSAILDAEKEERNGSISGDGGRCGSSADINSTGYITRQVVQAETARFELYMDLLTDIPVLFVLLFFGQVMDRLGRRPALLISTLGIIIKATSYILHQLLHFPLEVLLVAGPLEAASGGFATFVTASYAYLNDTIDIKDRAKRITILQVSYNIGMALSNFVTGIAIEKLGFLWPMFIVFCGYSVNFGYIFFFIPETRRQMISWKDLSPSYIIDSSKVLMRKRAGNGRKILLVFTAAWLLVGFAWSESSIYTLYKLNYPFCWTPSLLGLQSMIGLSINSIAQLCSSLFLYSHFDHAKLTIISLLSSIGSNLTLAAANKDWILWLSTVIGLFASVSIPLMRSIISGLVLPREQGSLYSCLMALDKLAAIAGSAVYTNIYAATLDVFSGAVFVVVAGFVLLAIITIGIFIHMRNSESTGDQCETSMNQRY